jgi:hypothetical protein
MLSSQVCLCIAHYGQKILLSRVNISNTYWWRWNMKTRKFPVQNGQSKQHPGVSNPDWEKLQKVTVIRAEWFSWFCSLWWSLLPVIFHGSNWVWPFLGIYFTICFLLVKINSSGSALIVEESQKVSSWSYFRMFFFICLSFVLALKFYPILHNDNQCGIRNIWMSAELVLIGLVIISIIFHVLLFH